MHLGFVTGDRPVYWNGVARGPMSRQEVREQRAAMEAAEAARQAAVHGPSEPIPIAAENVEAVHDTAVHSGNATVTQQHGAYHPSMSQRPYASPLESPPPNPYYPSPLSRRPQPSILER